MNAEAILTVAGLGFYGLGFAAALLNLIRRDRPSERWILGATFAAVVCVGAALGVRALETGRLAGFGRFEAVACYCCAVTVVYLISALRHELRGIPAILLPYVMALLLFSLPGMGERAASLPEVQGRLLALHIGTAFLGYALFTLLSVLAAAYLIRDRALRRKEFGILFERLPSLESLDQLMRAQIILAFVTFSISILLGAALAHLNQWERRWLLDPKAIATAATWVVYGILFYLRTWGDYHGRKVALVAIGGLLWTLFTFIGVHLMNTSMHDFVFLSAGGK